MPVASLTSSIDMPFRPVHLHFNNKLLSGVVSTTNIHNRVAQCRYFGNQLAGLILNADNIQKFFFDSLNILIFAAVINMVYHDKKRTAIPRVDGRN